MDIQELKKELGISNKEIAEFFGFKNTISYLNSSAKKRYETALIRFMSILNRSSHKWVVTACNMSRASQKVKKDMETLRIHIYSKLSPNSMAYIACCVFVKNKKAL